MRTPKEIGEIIKKKRISKGLTLSNVVDQLYKKGIDITEVSCSRYEHGKVNLIPYEILEALGEILNFDPSYLLGWVKNSGTIITKTGKTGSNLVEVYKDILNIKDISKMKPTTEVEIPENWSLLGMQYIGVKITDPDLYPEFFIGDIAIIRIQNSFDDGDICAVSINDTGLALKEIHKKTNKILLKHPNLSTRDLILRDKEIEVLGKVVEIRRTF